MPSNKPKVFAYLPQEIYDHVCDYKARHQLPSDSQALIAILTEFFDYSQAETPVATNNNTPLEQRIDQLERMFDSLNLMVLGILHAEPESELEETNGSLPLGELEETNDSLPLGELEETNGSLPDGELEETNGSLPDGELEEMARKHQSLIICKVSRANDNRPLYWSGSFKEGFVNHLELARTYNESTIKQVLGKITKSQHAPVDKTEFLSYRRLGELERMAAAIASPSNS